MNGGHDLGGMMGFGPIDPSADEPVFHTEWERRTFAFCMAYGWIGEWNIDFSRHTHERKDPLVYLAMSYYERWLDSAEKTLVEYDFVSADEIRHGRSKRPPAAIKSRLLAENVAKEMATRNPYTRPTDTTPFFGVGHMVKTRNMHPAGHTRLPRYARGHTGQIERVNGFMVFPDSNAHGRGENPSWNYTVVFSGNELWGPGADPTLSVSLDLWEPYLETV